MISFLLLPLFFSPFALASPSHDQSTTALQRHVEFFDRDGDGIIYPRETYQGFRVLGFSRATSLMAMVLINAALSYPTRDPESWMPSASLPIYVKNIHKGKHGSDSGMYDDNGRFVPARFEELFTKFAVTRQDGMSLNEIMSMIESNKEANDSFGSSASKREWSFAFDLAKDKDGYLSKDSLKGILDGSLFYEIERQNQQTSDQ